MTVIAFTIPGRPTAWQRTVGKNGIKFTPRTMRDAQNVIKALAAAAMRSAPPLIGALRLEVLCVYGIPPSWTRAKQECARSGKLWKTTVPDHDNLIKQCSDALNGIVYADDAQLVTSTVAKRYGQPERTEVRISLLDVLHDHSPKDAYKAMVARLAGQDSLPGVPSIASDALKRLKGPGGNG